jgi:D-aminoacyl-tRNA deacylase
MIALLQRVSEAHVSVDSLVVGKIGRGLMVLLCAERDDTPSQVAPLLQKLVNYRVFADKEGKMNVSLLQLAKTGGISSDLEVASHEVGMLFVPQFTLAADTRSGTRPSFTPAAPPELGRCLFDDFLSQARALKVPGLAIESGVFGANMQVSLINDGPVSFWLQTRKSSTF